jgi:hypothetical protein
VARLHLRAQFLKALAQLFNLPAGVCELGPRLLQFALHAREIIVPGRVLGTGAQSEAHDSDDGSGRNPHRPVEIVVTAENLCKLPACTSVLKGLFERGGGDGLFGYRATYGREMVRTVIEEVKKKT